jgi:hypothetical protein
MRFGLYLLGVVLLYVGDLVTGVWVLFYGLQFPTPDVSLISLLNWAAAWALCYLGYRRSKIFGYALVILTVVLTVLIVWLAILGVWYLAASNE